MNDPVSDLDDAQDREAHDAATPPRRTWRRWWPLLLLLLLPFIVLVALSGEDPPPPPPAPVVEVPVVEPPPPPEPIAPIEVPVEPPPPKKKQATKAPSPPKPKSRPVEVAGSTVMVASTNGGQSSVRRAAERALRDKLGSAEAPASEATYSLTIQIEESKANADEVTVRCAVSIALLPKKNVVASLKARADAAGEGTPTEELFADAAAACGQTLGGDIRGWLRSH